MFIFRSYTLCQKLIICVLTLPPLTEAAAGCGTLGYHNVEDTAWFGRPLLAFTNIPAGAPLIVDPLDDYVVGIQEIGDDGIPGALVGISYTPDDTEAVDIVQSDALLAVGKRYKVVTNTESYHLRTEEDPPVFFSVIDADATSAPTADVTSARYRVGHCPTRSIEATLVPWDGPHVLHELAIAKSLNDDFTGLIAGSLVVRDPTSVPAEGAWLRTRTWLANGEHGEWSEPSRVGCACENSGGNPIALVAGLAWVLARRRNRRI